MHGPARSALAAEAAAVGVADHADLVRGNLEHRGDAERHVALRLVAAAAGEGSLAGVPLRDHAEGLHRVRAEAVPTELLADDVVGVAKSLVDVAPAEFLVQDDVAALLLEHQRRAGLHGLERVDDGRQRLVLDVDLLERVLGEVAAAWRRRRRPARPRSAPSRPRGNARPSRPGSSRAARSWRARPRPSPRRRHPAAPARDSCRCARCARAETGCAGSRSAASREARRCRCTPRGP